MKDKYLLIDRNTGRHFVTVTTGTIIKISNGNIPFWCVSIELCCFNVLETFIDLKLLLLLASFVIPTIMAQNVSYEENLRHVGT